MTEEETWKAAGPDSVSVLREVGTPLESVAQRFAKGRVQRAKVPRETQSNWTRSTDRRDPVDVLVTEGESRQQDLLPLRYGRMSVSPFTFYRGAAAIMAADLRGTPNSGINVQTCGDCHLSNFGVYASPERNLLFDINDFDETLPGPWEWDLKRLAASFVVGCRSTKGFSSALGRESAIAVSEAYRLRMIELTQMSNLDLWYSHVDAEALVAGLSDKGMRTRTGATLQKAKSKDRLKAFTKLTVMVNGQPHFRDDPPVLVRMETADIHERIHALMHAYAQTLQQEKRHLLAQYNPVDVARKVVGVGSVGTRCMVALLEGKDANDPLFLQVKESEPSVLEGHLPKSKYRNSAQRVVVGQRLMQAFSDIFLGWIKGLDGRDYYFRQLQDMKGGVEFETMKPAGVILYARLCGQTLARAHARSGDRFELAGYVGKSAKLDTAIADFAENYADQNDRDYAELVKAIKSGKLPTEEG